MATNWGYVPLIGEPVSLTNDIGDVIPRLPAPNLIGPPRANKLKTYFTVLNFVSTAAPDNRILVRTKLPVALTQEQIDTNLNAFLPIITITKATFGANDDWHVDMAGLVPGSNQLLDATFILTSAPVFPAQSLFCIDYSHSITN